MISMRLSSAKLDSKESIKKVDKKSVNLLVLVNVLSTMLLQNSSLSSLIVIKSNIYSINHMLFAFACSLRNQTHLAEKDFYGKRMVLTMTSVLNC